VFDLSGQAALVTGSSRGIGRAIAAALAEAGAGVVVHGRAPSDELKQSADEAGALAVVGNLSEARVAERIVAEAHERLGRLDVLVNNAGSVVPQAADELVEANWHAVLDVNLKAAFLCARAASFVMRKHKYGRIVNISSQAADAAVPSYVHYGVSKAGLNALTRYLAVEWAPLGITVNAVAPAFVRTEMAERVFADLPELYDDQLARVPVRRMCEPREVAAAVLYLSSREAGFTTGTILHVDGGYLAV
jgi:NAD(P)-dependent dehydrogenase (short-subunit alcohol dehydrogenase family)